jgi:hypothetical protein
MFVSDIINATSSFMDSGGSILGLVILFGIALGVMALLFFVSSNIEKYRRFKKLFRFLYGCFGYCAYGMLTVAVIGVPVYLGYVGFITASANPEGLIEFVKWTGIILGGFIGFVLVGYCTKNRVWKRIFKFHRVEKENKIYRDNLRDMPIDLNKNVVEE